MRPHRKNDLNLTVIWATILVVVLLIGTYPRARKRPTKIVQPASAPAQWKDEAPIPFGVRENKTPRIERNTTNEQVPLLP